jgi:hypothetical protein
MKETIIKELIREIMNEARMINERKENVIQKKENEIKLRVLNQMTESLGKETLSMILKERMMQELKRVRMVKEVCMPRLRGGLYEEESSFAV